MNNEEASKQVSSLFISGLNQDLDSSFAPEGSWSFARNASKVTASGSLQTLSNESATALCSMAPYTIMGLVHLYGDNWAVFSTDNTNSEIGWFDDSACSYRAVVTDPCNNQGPKLNFNTKYLIKGISKQNFDCSWEVYFADALNPDRAINITNPQFVQICTDEAGNHPGDSGYPIGCVTCIPTCSIDADAIRLASLVDSPCVTVSKSRSGGNLLNGSYFVVIAYTINEQKITDYFPPSNVQPLFSHNNLGTGLSISFTGLDTDHFTEFELVVVRTINLQTSAKRIGYYSTFTKEVLIDNISESLVSIPIEQIPIRTPIFEKSEAIYQTADYAIRVAPTTKFDFNYQPLANRIVAFWESVEYPANYYKAGGNNTTYLRDEIYAFFIRWVYNTGERSSSYHIPGRRPGQISIGLFEDSPYTNPDSIYPGNELYFEINNTASVYPAFIGPYTLPDGGRVINEGYMGYWQSSEIYPLDQPQIWNASSHPWSNIFPAVDLCGKPIRHHKMPDNLTDPTTAHVVTTPTGVFIRLLGVKFTNIRVPVDNDGVPIPGIVGYEILRGSREGNKTVIAKGIINNMRKYRLAEDDKFTYKGLYQNYPYNPLTEDETLENVEQAGGFTFSDHSGQLNNQFTTNIHTFHSPDTTFKHPFLSVNELKLYGQMYGSSLGNFEPVPHHPKEKLIGDAAFIVAALIGIGEALLAIRGLRKTIQEGPRSTVISLERDKYTVPTMTAGTLAGPVSGTAGSSQASYDVNKEEAPYGDVSGDAAKNTVHTVVDQAKILNSQGWASTNIGFILGGLGDQKDASKSDTMTNFTATNGVSAGPVIFEVEDSPFTRVTGFIPLAGIITASYYWTIGADTAIKLIYAIVPFDQYAYRYRSHGLYNNVIQGSALPGSRRYLINNSNYLDSQRQSFTDASNFEYQINNLYRTGTVVVGTTKQVPIPQSSPAGPVFADNTLNRIGNTPIGDLTSSPTLPFQTHVNSHYAALIQRFRNQYGQLDSILQIPISCKIDLSSSVDMSTPVLFGGDTYIGRYTEKNTFFYFYDWLMDQPDGYEYNYRDYYMITYPRYWADFTKYEVGEFMTNILSGAFLTNPLNITGIDTKSSLDGNAGSVLSLGGFLGFLSAGLRFKVSDAYFYLFQSGVRDFFVESEINIGLRDWNEIPQERFYDPYEYTDTFAMFDPRIIKFTNYYKYDYSLSVSRLFFNFVSWGNLQARSYDPLVAQTCYVYRPKRVIYSLPQNLENKKDYWKVYLANNYKDFYSKVAVIKPISKNGAIILFTEDSPIIFQGTETLNTDIGTKITIGDGELFSQPQQSVVNVDVSHEYGSCQDRLSVINTPFGLYYMCANQGKVFRVGDHLDDITYHGLKFWFKEYLPFKLTEDFPTFDILDNPVAGIGCQAVYDNQIETIYFCKRDYKLRDEFIGKVNYQGNGIFVYTSSNGEIPVSLKDPVYFYDASFTVSYDPKVEKGGWISFHDWHPDLNLPSRSNFLTIKDNQIWRHNSRRDLFCNYYDQSYPWELEYIASTELTVNTLRSIEYYLECYKYAPGRLDRYQLLDFNFDHAVIYNSEQVSGMLDLKLTPKNDSWGRLGYPKKTLQPSFEILYDKVEQKFRFDAFGDITDNRGEFSSAQRMIWITEPNGYIRTLNPLNLNYNKLRTQVKKFRMYTNRVLLTKRNPGEINMTMKASISKELLSMR